MKKVALDYIRRGWAVLPITPLEKTPATKHGFKDAVTTEEGVNQLFTNPNCNIGIATGKVSGFFVVDIDSADAEKTFAEWQAQHGAIPPTLAAKTIKGVHYYFKYPSFMEIGSNAKKLAAGIDLRGDGGYVVAPPSKRTTGDYYWVSGDSIQPADAPAWLLNKISQTMHREVVKVGYDTEWADDDVYDMLQCLSPDCGYDEWVRIGMALHAAGKPEAMWDDWSSKGKSYAGSKDVRTHWRSFKGTGVSLGTLVHYAMQAGWQPPQKMSSVALRQAEDALLNEIATPVAELKQPYGMPYVGGVIGRTVDWINETAIAPQPELALLNTLAALGGVFGRRYRSPFDTRPNVFMIGIAGSGSGKDHSRKRLKRLMKKAGLDSYIGSDTIRSAQGIVTSMCNRASQVMMIDEIGFVMQAINDKNSAAYMKNAGGILTMLYSSSSGSFAAGQLADEAEEEKVLHEPALSIFGTTTLDKYASALSRANIESGEVNRFLIYKIPNDIPDIEDNELRDPPPDLVSLWRTYAPSRSQMKNDVLKEVEDIKTVYWSDSIKKRLFDIESAVRKRMREEPSKRALFVRYRENVIKIAMIIAISDSPDNPEVDDFNLGLAIQVVDRCMDFVIEMVDNYMFENEHQKNNQEVLTFIRQNRKVKHSDLLGRFRGINKKSIQEIIDVLFERGEIDVIDGLKPVRGPTPKVYVYVGGAK